MILKNENKYIEFSIEDYEFPDIHSQNNKFDYDANWLICKIHYVEDKTDVTYKEQCLLTYELEYMVEEISKIVDSKTDYFIPRFIEPNLYIAAGRIGGKIVMIFEFFYEMNAKDIKKIGISVELTHSEANEILCNLKEMLNNYPIR